MGRRTFMGTFIHNKYSAMKIRCGYYPNSQTKAKCLSYENIKITFSLEEFKNWCYNQEALIKSLSRPSIDRIDKTKDYALDNMQIIELTANIAKDKLVSKDGLCTCYNCGETKLLEFFAVDKRRKTTGRSTICKPCDNARRKRK